MTGMSQGFWRCSRFCRWQEIRQIEKLEGVDLNSAKAVLAFEATLLAHGKQEAVKAYQASVSMFGDRDVACRYFALKHDTERRFTD